jgi:hypothetical protein
MAALSIEGLLQRNMRNGHASVTISQVKIVKTVGFIRLLNTLIINSDFFGVLNVVIDDHLFSAYNGHPPNLAGVKPAQVGVGHEVVRKPELNIGHVVDIGKDGTLSPGAHKEGLLPEHIEENRHVVGRQVPDDVNVVLKEAQIKAGGIHVADLPQLTAGHHLPQEPDGIVVE